MTAEREITLVIWGLIILWVRKTDQQFGGRGGGGGGGGMLRGK